MKKILLSIFGIAFLSVILYSATQALAAAPSNLAATAISCSKTKLSWTDNSSDETGFKIERKEGVSGSWSQIGTADANATSYDDSGLTGGVAYYYRVAALALPPSLKYKCSDTACVQDSTGAYTTSNCDNACSASIPKYKCSDGSCLRDDINGTYTDSSCNNSCASANQAPVAATSISKDGVAYANSVTVTKGVPVAIYLNANDSSDANGWTDAVNGVSTDPGKCEWNSDLNQGNPTFESASTVNHPISPSACNASLGTMTFNDAPGTYIYQVLRITDKPGSQSNIGSVSVTVQAEQSSLEAVEIVNDCTIPGAPASSDINFQSGVVYTTVGTTNLKMDIAWPKTSGLHPLVVLIHGGGWVIGDRTGLDSIAKLLAGQGYVAASVDYRLLKKFPAPVEDVRCAVKWLRANASAYSIDPSRVAALGTSAGAHLAGMLGTASGVSGLDGNCSTSGSPSVNAVLGYFGAYDLRYSDEIGRGLEFVNVLLGDQPEHVPTVAALASPITHVDASDPPQLLLHATGDIMVFIKQSRDMKSALQAAGARATLVETDGGHGAPDPFSSVYPTATCTALKFLSEQLNP